MRYLSTRGGVAPIDFSDAVMMGLADDGGLLVPESIPRADYESWRQLSYPELALQVFRPFVTGLPLEELVERTYSPANYGGPVAPIRKVGSQHILELFHGPTLAFKDVALQLLGNLFEHILGQRGGKLNILAATSGDTGSAAIYGVRGRQGIQIFVMHPAGRVSPLQERQMTTVLDANVHNLSVTGSFDDCQQIMKSLAGDLDFKRRVSLGAVNSVNWARVMAQIVYYFAAYFQVCRPGQPIRFSVPTGNFGDILAGWYAHSMGLPIEQLILATNANDILARFFETGVYERGPVYYTSAPAMDIQVASNFERYLYYRAPESVGKLMAEFARTGRMQLAPDPLFRGFACQEPALLDTIRRYWTEHQALLDPHTATGVWAAEQAPTDTPTVCLATAHPAKFSEAITQATGQDLARHPKLDALRELPTRCESVPAEAAVVQRLIEEAA